MFYLEHWYLDVIAMVCTFITSFVLSYFFSKIFNSRKESKYIVFNYLGIIYGTYLICRLFPVLYEFRAIFITLSYIVSLCLLSKDKLSKKLFVIFIIYIFQILVDIPMSMVTFNKYGYTFNEVNSMMDDEYFALYNILFNDANTLSLTGLNNVFLTLFGLTLMMFYKKESRHLYVWIISFVICFLVLSNSIFSYYYLNKTIGAIVLILSQVIAISLLIFIIERLSLHFKYDKSLEENKYLKEKEEMQYKYYEMVRNKDEEVRKINHDIKNNLTIMYNLKDDKVRNDMIREILSSLDKHYLKKYTNQDILNVILNIKVSESINKSIKIDISIKNNLDFMNEIDVSKLITNILDNALEASSKSENKHIKFEIRKKMNYVIIECVNTFNGDIKLNKNNELVSSKDGDHGYGTKIIKEVVNKYNGNISYDIKNNKFKIIIMIEITK